VLIFDEGDEVHVFLAPDDEDALAVVRVRMLQDVKRCIKPSLSSSPPPTHQPQRHLRHCDFGGSSLSVAAHSRRAREAAAVEEIEKSRISSKPVPLRIDRQEHEVHVPRL